MRVLILTIIGLACKHAYAQKSDEAYFSLPQDNIGGQVFTINPSLQDPNKFLLQYFEVVKNMKTEFEIIDNGVPAKVEQKNFGTDRGLGLLLPIGAGSAVGILGQTSGTDLRTDYENASDLENETFRENRFGGRFIVQLVEKLKFGLDLRLTNVKNDVAGAYFVASDDRTKYRGTMNGFTIGFAFKDQLTKAGVSYSPPMRGKAEVDGEQIIITEPGLISLDLGYGQPKDWYFAVKVNRWLHQRDDRAKVQESPTNQRRISYSGLSLEQFLLPTMQYSVGVDTPPSNNTFLRLAVSMNEYAFLFANDRVPGDDEDLETKVRSQNAKAVAVFQPSDFSIHLGYSYEARKASEVDDTEGWWSGSYDNYKSVEQYYFAEFIYQP